MSARETLHSRNLPFWVVWIGYGIGFRKRPITINEPNSDLYAIATSLLFFHYLKNLLRFCTLCREQVYPAIKISMLTFICWLLCITTRFSWRIYVCDFGYFVSNKVVRSRNNNHILFKLPFCRVFFCLIQKSISSFHLNSIFKFIWLQISLYDNEKCKFYNEKIF